MRVLILASVGLLLNSGCTSQPSAAPQSEALARPARMVAATPRDQTARTYSGRVQAARRTPLAFRVGGPVVELPVSEGQRVKAGDLLARIDTRDYRVQIRGLEARLKAARAQAKLSQVEFRRTEGLFTTDVATRADLDRARTAQGVAHAGVETIEAALKAARLALKDTRLVAPHDGVIAARTVELHQTVAPGMPVVQFQDFGAIDVTISVPERDIAALTAEGKLHFEVTFDALPGHRHQAQVHEFGTEVDPITQTFAVRLRLDTPTDVPLFAGMTASAQWLRPGTDAGPLMIPLSAVFSPVPGEHAVWRYDPETHEPEQLTVAIGASSEAGVEILSGLRPGDQVVASGVHLVRPHQPLRPLEP